MVLCWSIAQPNIHMLHVQHGEVISSPQDTVERVDPFLGGALNKQQMAVSAEPSPEEHGIVLTTQPRSAGRRDGKHCVDHLQDSVLRTDR